MTMASKDKDAEAGEGQEGRQARRHSPRRAKDAKPPPRKPRRQGSAEGEKAARSRSAPVQPAAPEDRSTSETVVPALMKQFGYKTKMQVPRVTKITLNMGVGEAVADKKILDNAVGDLQKIAGQKPVITKSKKSIAAFKIRDGYPVGTMVTLRSRRMYEFLDRLVTIALPRVRDFRGVSGRAFDGRGNYNMGIKEQIIFPEIEYDKVDALRGMNISITTTAKTDEEAKRAPRRVPVPVQN